MSVKLVVTSVLGFMLLASVAFAAQKELNFLVYMAADNDLHPYALQNLNQMRTALANRFVSDNINIIVEVDGNGKDADLYSNPANMTTVVENGVSVTKPIATGKRDAYRIVMNSEGEKTYYIGERNTGDYRELQDFLRWGMKNFSAKKNMVVVWNHGGGWKDASSTAVDGTTFTAPVLNPFTGAHNYTFGGENSDLSAIAMDFSSGNEISVAQLAQVFATLKSEGLKVDILGFDACLMSMIEVQYELRNAADVFVSSEETIPGEGWPYDRVLTDINSFGTEDIARSVVRQYTKYYAEKGKPSTLSAVRASKIMPIVQAFKAAVPQFEGVEGGKRYTRGKGSAQAYTGEMGKDLADFMNLAGVPGFDALVADAVIANGYSGTSMAASKGIAFYAPEDRHSFLLIFVSGGYSGEYKNVPFAQLTGWDRIVEANTLKYNTWGQVQK